jgi:leader peptidase (prepilin peptidase)/N-methyltransferase
MFEPILALLASNETAWLGFVFVLSLLVGSFLNVVIYRLPLMMERQWRCECRDLLADELKKGKPKEEKPFNLIKPDSHCPGCKKPIKAWQNIPVISYLLLRGKCSECGTRVSLRYPFIELLTALASTAVAAQFGYSVQACLLIFLTWCFVSLIFIDIDHMLLPDQITLPLLWLVLLASTQNVFLSPSQTLYGAAVGYLSLWSVFWLFKLITGKEGMGHGDFKLMAIVGALVGMVKLPMVILMSSLVGALIGIGGIVFADKDKNNPIPFGPYIAIAGWIVIMWGQPIFDWYIQFVV